MLNDITANKLMTTITNQSFDNFFVKILEIDKLHAETINGVPVEGAARKSRENLIRGNSLYIHRNARNAHCVLK